jgi:hypothetical protein
VKTGMRREYGRSLRGKRVVGTRPFKSWKTVSVIGAIRLGHQPRLMTYPAAVTGPVFLRFVRTRLVPWTRRGDVVVMDNLNIHKMVAYARRSPPQVGRPSTYRPTAQN